MKCPYMLCMAEYEAGFVAPYPGTTGIRKQLIPLHPLEHRVLGGNCPASLMYYPFDDDTLIHLRNFYIDHMTQIHQSLREEFEKRQLPPEVPPESTTLRGPHRVGREPSPKSKDWVLGGRQEEDVVEPPDVFQRPSVNPINIQGTEMGHHVASIGELIGLVNGAAVQGGEVVAQLQHIVDDTPGIHEQLEQIKGTIMGVMGEHNSELLNNYIAQIGEVQDRVAALTGTAEEGIALMEVAQGKGEDFIGRLLGS